MLWNPAFFGVKPELVLKNGFVVQGLMGDANASIPTPQPVIYRPMYATLGKALSKAPSPLSLKQPLMVRYMRNWDWKK